MAGTWLNDQAGEVAKELFLNKPLFSDVAFLVEGAPMQLKAVAIQLTRYRQANLCTQGPLGGTL